MKNQFRPILILFVLLTLVTGVIYPLLVTGLSQVLFPFQANGSLIEDNGILVGSQLIGQNFTGTQYFWGRPSATSGTPYNAFDPTALTGSSGSNYGPLSQSLIESVQERVNVFHTSDPTNTLNIPVDLVTASGSGLDPHISLAAVYYQAPRVAQSRGMSDQELANFIKRFLEKRQFGLLGETRVNVLLLNLALDGIELNK